MNTQQVILSPIPLDELTSRLEAVIEAKLLELEGRFTNQPERPTYATRQEVAGMLKISLPTLHELTKQGKLEAYRIGQRVLYKVEEVESAVQGLCVNPNRRHKNGR